MNDRLDSPDAAAFARRIEALRGEMARENLAVVLIPSADPHLSEYLPGRWQGREWLSGFTGSVGTLVVTAGFAGLWVDSRYWTQAEAQLSGTGIALMKMMGGQQTAPHVDWLAQNVPSGATVAVDGAVLGVAAARSLGEALTARGIVLRTDLDLLDAVWPARPGLPQAAVYEHAAPHASVSRADKLAQVRRAMQEKGAQWHFISTLDDLAWLFNLRGADVSYNPVFVAHALVGIDDAVVFVADGKVPDPLAASLARDNVRIEPYARASDALAALPAGSALLIDSGGQYLSGTTDITRVVPVGAITAEHKRDFTVVLKGTMALSRARFPRGIRSPMLDAIARAPIWEAGADYGHGTGHGVGYFLNVHEGPQVISHYAPAEPWTAMEEGMITSIEPGIYRPGKWGIRIENLVLNQPAGKTEFGDFLEFETLTLCPIDTRCIDLPLLREDERAWLNAYHATVRERVSPHVSGDALAWLETRTQPV